MQGLWPCNRAPVTAGGIPAQPVHAPLPPERQLLDALKQEEIGCPQTGTHPEET